MWVSPLALSLKRYMLYHDIMCCVLCIVCCVLHVELFIHAISYFSLYVSSCYVWYPILFILVEVLHMTSLCILVCRAVTHDLLCTCLCILVCRVVFTISLSKSKYQGLLEPRRTPYRTQTYSCSVDTPERLYWLRGGTARLQVYTYMCVTIYIYCNGRKTSYFISKYQAVPSMVGMSSWDHQQSIPRWKLRLGTYLRGNIYMCVYMCLWLT